MKVRVYTKEDRVKSIELSVGVAEYLCIAKALSIFAGNTEMPVDDRLLAVVMTDEMEEKEQVEMDEFN